MAHSYRQLWAIGWDRCDSFAKVISPKGNILAAGARAHRGESPIYRGETQPQSLADHITQFDESI